MDPKGCSAVSLNLTCMACGIYLWLSHKKQTNKQTKTKTKTKNKKPSNPVYGRTGLLSWSGMFFFFFFFFSLSFCLVGKMALKTPKFKKKKKKGHILQESFGKIFWLIFKNFLPKFVNFWSRNSWFYKILEKKFKICQNGKFGSVTSVKWAFFVFVFVFFMAIWATVQHV